jgi:hypothetical protein
MKMRMLNTPPDYVEIGFGTLKLGAAIAALHPIRLLLHGPAQQQCFFTFFEFALTILRQPSNCS